MCPRRRRLQGRRAGEGQAKGGGADRNQGSIFDAPWGRSLVGWSIMAPIRDESFVID